ncbi:MAG TPA: NUDIX hydrolase [Planctomycetes bacterium]|nr:NUDIX hydrolase [Planctomycetota bacterium]
MKRHPLVQTLSSTTLVDGGIFEVKRESCLLPSGLQQDLVVVDHPGAVCIAPVLADGSLLLVRQYRHAAGDWLLELPAGRLEAGEDPLRAARRELEEETGHRAAHWSPLRSFFAAPGFCSEVLTLFLARELERIPGGGKAPDPDEEIELERLHPSEILGGEQVCDAKTLLAAALLSRD